MSSKLNPTSKKKNNNKHTNTQTHKRPKKKKSIDQTNGKLTRVLERSQAVPRGIEGGKVDKLANVHDGKAAVADIEGGQALRLPRTGRNQRRRCADHEIPAKALVGELLRLVLASRGVQPVLKRYRGPVKNLKGKGGREIIFLKRNGVVGIGPVGRAGDFDPAPQLARTFKCGRRSRSPK